MALFLAADRAFAKAVSDLSYCNPFLPGRIEHERAALGGQFDDRRADWNVHPDMEQDHPNVVRIRQRATEVLDRAGQQWKQKGAYSDADRALYEDLALFVLYHKYREGFDSTIDHGLKRRSARKRVGSYDQFSQDAKHLLVLPGFTFASMKELPHLFACFFQIRRAFHNTFSCIIGVSQPAVRLRAAVWQSVFTHDMRRYRRLLYDRMADYTTLVTGPSGTGKELVARAVGLSRYMPFNPQTQTFTEDFAGSFYPLNLSALSPTLIESELFGHKRGAFTGAVSDRAGWLEVCPPLGTVFLDEIGDLDLAIQVKLLRVLQTRVFSRLGQTTTHPFHGKIIAATNRDLARQMKEGHCRADFFYRLCSDMIVTPSLHERLADHSGELHELVAFITTRILGQEDAGVTQEVESWIMQHLGNDYPWPGNVRELEQCARNVLIRQAYRPLAQLAADGPQDPLETIVAGVRQGSFTAQELLERYCTIVYAQSDSYEQAARRLQLDRRTVKSRIDRDLLEQLRL